MSDGTPCALVRWWQRLVSPVHQDPTTILYGEYHGETVVLVPEMSSERPWLVARWIPDPEFVRIIDERAAERERQESRDDGERNAPDTTGMPAADRPPSLPGTDAGSGPDVNPAGQCGL